METCEVCNREKYTREPVRSIAALKLVCWRSSAAGDSGECHRLGYERLKAENASLLAEVAACHESLAEMRREFAAAEQRAEAAEKALRRLLLFVDGAREAGDLETRNGNTADNGLDEGDAMWADCLHEARAALHDEERSAPPLATSAAPAAPVVPNSAAQGEEK